MTDSHAEEAELAQILGDLQALCDFAYERGFHELGYDPVRDISVFSRKAVEELRIVEIEISVPSQALLLLKGK